MLIPAEAGADAAARLYLTAERRATSVVAYAECRAAIAAAKRSGRLAATEANAAVKGLDEIWPMLDRVSVSEAIVHRAGELAERRALRGFDAIHLASAFGLTREAAFASWDDELSRAARAEGLSLASSSTQR